MVGISFLFFCRANVGFFYELGLGLICWKTCQRHFWSAAPAAPPRVGRSGGVTRGRSCRRCWWTGPGVGLIPRLDGPGRWLVWRGQSGSRSGQLACWGPPTWQTHTRAESTASPPRRWPYARRTRPWRLWVETLGFFGFTGVYEAEKGVRWSNANLRFDICWHHHRKDQWGQT